MNVNKHEIFRYLGYKTREYDEKTELLVNEITAQALNILKPRSVYKEFSLEVSGDVIKIGQYEFKSKNLAANLSGCDRAIFFAGTLGTEADMLVRKYEVTSMVKAAVAQAVLSAVIEAYCDEVQEQIRLLQREQGYFLRPRFSAGYGDFALENQRAFFEALDITKKIGVQLNEQCLMIPTKSVTAVIGLTKSGESCNISKCKICDKKDCEFRNEF